MEMRDLLEKMMKFAGEKVGQKPGDQWRGSDKAPPGKKLVGDSILKDLSKGKTPKTKEQELSEEFQAFLEAEFKDTVDKRPARKSDRHPRGHKPEPRYKTVKADESYMSEKDIELQDYRTMSHKEFQTAYKMTKTEWINKNKSLVIQNPSIKKALGLEEGVPYKATNPHPASKDPIVAKVLKQMRPGLTGLEMNNEAFLYFAYEIGKMRAREMWEDYGPAIKYFYQSGIGVNEGWESGPEEYKEPYDDADDAYDRQRQEKIDTEAEREWAKLPKVSTYKLVGRGPNMEPNYAFGDTEYDTLEQAIEARKQLMADPKTPHPEHIGIQTLTRVVDKEQTDEAIDSDIVQPMGQDTFNRAGHNPILDKNDYLKRRSDAWNLMNQTTDPQTKEMARQSILDLDSQARAKKYIQSESRGHKIVTTKLKDIERSKNFRVPSAEERRELAQRMKDFEAQLAAAKSKKKQIKELAPTPPQGTANQKMNDPKQAQAVAQATQAIKTASGSSAPTTTIAKALDTASQGKPVMGQEASAIQPLMKDVATIAQNPPRAAELKTLLQKVNQDQLKAQQQTT